MPPKKWDRLFARENLEQRLLRIRQRLGGVRGGGRRRRGGRRARWRCAIGRLARRWSVRLIRRRVGAGRMRHGSGFACPMSRGTCQRATASDTAMSRRNPALRQAQLQLSHSPQARGKPAEPEARRCSVDRVAERSRVELEVAGRSSVALEAERMPADLAAARKAAATAYRYSADAERRPAARAGSCRSATAGDNRHRSDPGVGPDRSNP